MNEFKSMDYLQQLVNDYGKGTVKEFLESVSYMLEDNGHGSARNFMDDLYDIVEDEL